MNSKFLDSQLTELNYGVAQSNNAEEKTSKFHVSLSQDLRGQVQMLAGGTAVILIWPLFSLCSQCPRVSSPIYHRYHSEIYLALFSVAEMAFVVAVDSCPRRTKQEDSLFLFFCALWGLVG